MAILRHLIVLCLLHLHVGSCRLVLQPAAQATQQTADSRTPGGSADLLELLGSLSSVTTSGAGYVAPTQFQLWVCPHGPHHCNSSSGSTNSAISFQPTPPHKPLWPNWSQRDVWLFVLSGVTLFIAAGGGIGGGAVFVPLYIIVGGFTAAQAVALSNITILGGALANLIINSSKRHAVRDAPLIDWDLIMVMEPTTMLGALLGSYTNKLLPSWFTSCLMAALLVFLTWKLLLRGVKTFICESSDIILQRVQQQQQSLSGDMSVPLLAHAHDIDAAAAYTDDMAAAADSGGRSSNSKQHMGATAAGASAWMDVGTGAGDQRPERQSSGSIPTGRASAHSQDDETGDVLLSVPAALKPVATAATDAAGTPAAAAAGLHHETPHSGGSFSVETTPKAAHIPSTSPLLWTDLTTAPDDDAVAAAAAACPYVEEAHQKLQHQQRRRQALLLPRHSGRDSNGSNSSKLWRSVCCGCSCFDPTRLKLSTVQAYSRQQLPWQPLLTLFALACWVVASDTGKAKLPCGTLQYWAVVLSVVPPCLLVSLLVRQWLLAKTAVEAFAVAAVAAATVRGGGSGAQATAFRGTAAAAGPQQKSGIIHWTPRNSITYPLICSLAGVFAGLFGVGGGIVKGPLMLELGVLPDVAAATSATMIAFTAGSAAIVYLNFGGVVMDYAQALLLLGFVVTLAGQLVSTHLVRVLQRRSIIIFAMGLLMLLASVAAVLQMGLSTREAFEHPPMWKWGSICKHR